MLSAGGHVVDVGVAGRGCAGAATVFDRDGWRMGNRWEKSLVRRESRSGVAPKSPGELILGGQQEYSIYFKASKSKTMQQTYSEGQPPMMSWDVSRPAIATDFRLLDCWYPWLINERHWLTGQPNTRWRAGFTRCWERGSGKREMSICQSAAGGELRGDGMRHLDF